MNKYKRAFAGILLGATLLTGCAGNAHAVEKTKCTKMPGVQIYYAQNLTPKAVTHRGNDLFIEIVYGQVIDKKGNGRVTNPYDPDFDYISYKDFAKAGVVKKNDSVRTVFLYDIGNNEPDAIFARFDWRIRGGKTKLIGVDVDEIHEIIK